MYYYQISKLKNRFEVLHFSKKFRAISQFCSHAELKLYSGVKGKAVSFFRIPTDENELTKRHFSFLHCITFLRVQNVCNSWSHLSYSKSQLLNHRQHRRDFSCSFNVGYRYSRMLPSPGPLSYCSSKFIMKSFQSAHRATNMHFKMSFHLKV